MNICIYLFCWQSFQKWVVPCLGMKFMEYLSMMSPQCMFSIVRPTFVVVETKGFVISNVNVILTPQTCGQRSSTSAGSKR